MPNLLRKIVRSFGMDIVGYPPADTRTAHLAHLLNHQGVDLVFDIGANLGQYASTLRRAGYVGGIVSVEPVSNAHDALLSAASSDANWQVAPRLAVGPFEGEVTIHVSNRSDMSSVLPMREETLMALPKSYYVGKEQVEQVTLDALFDRYGQGAKRPFIKIDTQGYEGRILESGTGALAAVHGLQLEMSLVPLYEGEANCLDILRRVRELGFEPHLFLPGYFSKRLGRQLQVDGVFFRAAEGG